ncbi:OmpA family protein [Primorskyibacter sp. 2E107]|uniref:OmpA family protein n=1 Tax=Primorskyibacter sp. 2E107 TaxID=3403458 RepID=UPI003AF82F8B
MKQTLLATASAVALVLSGAAPAQAQSAQPGGLLDSLTSLDQMSDEQLDQLVRLCEEKGQLPGQLSCDAVTDAMSTRGAAQSGQAEAAQSPETPAADPSAETASENPPTPEAPVAEAPAEQTEPETPVAEAPAEQPEPETPAAEAPTAEVEPETPVVDAPAAEVEPEAPVAEAPADPAPEAPAVTESVRPPVKEPAESAADTAAPAPDQSIADAPDAVQPNTTPEDVEAIVRELSGQEQADAVSRDSDRPAAAAASGDGASDAAEPEMTEEQVSEDDVRRSTEDFVTNVLTGKLTPEAGERDDDSGNDTARTIAGAALLGLGAAALADILNDGDRVVSNSGDRVVVESDGQLRVLRNDDALLRRPGADVQTYRYDDGSTRNVVTYEDGTVVETIRAADGRVLRRARTLADGTEVVLFDDTLESEQVVVNELPQVGERNTVNFREVAADELAAALAAQEPETVGRRFSLNQVRNIDAVRRLVPEISVDTINFQTNSAAIRAEEAEELAELGNAMRRLIERNPGEVFLVEGHTDAVGQYSYNLALSDRRAESVALALTEYFQVPPENMVLQGYGETDLLVETEDAERVNRRAAVRRITPLLN